MSFKGPLASAASKIGRTASSAPSPSASVASNNSPHPDTPAAPPKRKRDAPSTVYSQPENTGSGHQIQSQLLYSQQYLRTKGDPKTVTDIFNHLSLSRYSESHKELFVRMLRSHPRISWTPDPKRSEQTLISGTYIYRPVIPDVRDKTALVAYLQRRKDARGVPVKDLKDGWPDCEDALVELEAEHRITVIRTKKDSLPRTVWLADPTLYRKVDPEFQAQYLRVKVPTSAELPKKLLEVGQKPTSEEPGLVAAPTKKDKQKKRAVRKTGKTTNQHMEQLLKDYSASKRLKQGP